jgi:putative ABC transport system permease protein
MSTALRERPVAGGSGEGGVAARRAVIRWVWRVFRREWRQQLLALGLLTVAVAATVVGAAIAANTPSKAATTGTFGTADYLVSIPGSDPDLSAGIAAIKQRAGTVDVIENQKIAAGSVQSVLLRAQDPHGAYGYPMLYLVAGRYPSGPGEVAVTDQVATLFNLHIGGTWRQDGRALRVVGQVENPQNLQDSFALVAPGQIRSPSQVIVLSDDPALGAVKLPAPSVVVARPSSSGGLGPTEIVLALATFGMLFIGLVAVAAFTVTAQRRLRSLGMLAALGAADRHIRLVMIANGVVVGVAAAVAGTAAGLIAWTFSISSVQSSSGHRVAWTDLPWGLIVLAVVLAVVTAAAAAWWPARTVSRIPVVAALSGRPGHQKPTHRFVVPGVALLAVGAGFLAAAGAGNGSPPLLIAGILGTTLGALLLAPLAITGLSALCGRAPLPIQLAVRDLARYRTRSGAALAAIFVAIEIAAIVAIGFTARYSNPVALTGPNLSANELILYDASPDNSGGVPDRSTTTQQDIGTAVQALGASIHAKAVIGLDLAVSPSAPSFGGVEQTAGLSQVEGNGYQAAGQLYVATPGLLSHYGIKPGGIDSAADVLTSRTGLDTVSQLQLDPFGEGCPAAGTCTFPSPKIQILRQLPGDVDEPNLLITQHAMQKLKLRAVPAGWLIQTPTALTPAQINSARQTAISIGGIIDTRNSTPSLSELSGGATAAGILLALGVLAMTVGLVRSETAADLRTLTAAGASGTARRSLTGVTAAALALLGAILGTGTAYAVGVAWYRKSLSTTIGHVPVTDLLLILVGLPVIAFVGGWLLAGREPSAVSRQALE